MFYHRKWLHSAISVLSVLTSESMTVLLPSVCKVSIVNMHYLPAMEWDHLPLDTIGQSLVLLQKEVDREFFSFCIPDEGLGHHSSTVAQPRVIQDSDVAGYQKTPTFTRN